jgi:hypothetical protein
VVQIQSEPSARPGDSGTVGVTPGILPARSVRSKLLRARSKSRRLRRRAEGRHSTPERVLHGNFRLPCANLLKAEQLEENPFDSVAVEQPEVTAGELVDF